MAARSGIDAMRLEEAVIGRGEGFGSSSPATMSNTSSKCRSSCSRASTASAWLRVPLVRISLRPGSLSMATPSGGLGSSGEWSTWCTKSRKSSGFMPCSVISPRIEVP